MTNKTIAVNPIVAKKLLTELMTSENGIIRICAKNLGINHKTLIAILDAMAAHDFITTVPLPASDITPFSLLGIDSDDTEIEVMLLDPGKRYLVTLHQ